QTMKEKLQLPGFESKSPAAARLSDPIVDTPMLLTLDDTLPYDENPRTTRNPKYDDIKESIRQRGLDTPPPVTRKPGEEKFRIRNGGNTRLAILNELYRETGDEKFFRFHCLFRPWDAVRGEIISLTGHLAENDLQGQLLFIERAIGVDKARA
ncbi:transcriptional regulator, partial [Rhodobacteraceae bacterium PD-2]